MLETNQTTLSPSNSHKQNDIADQDDDAKSEEEELPRSKPVVAIVGRSGGPTGTRSILSQPGGVNS